MALLFSGVTLLTVYYAVRQNAEQRLQQETDALTQQVAAQLEAELAKYAYLPGLLAENPDVQLLLQSPQADAALAARLNQMLEKANRITGASDIYLLRPDGLTIAASNWDQEEASFIGKDFSFRPYFQQAMQGRLGRYYALGTTSGERGYYLASPVRNSTGTITGVMTVKINISLHEANWQWRSAHCIVTDPEGVVFLSSNPAWRLHSLQTLSPAVLASLRKNHRYADLQIPPLPNLRLDPAAASQYATDGVRQYLAQRLAMASAGWTVYVLNDASSITHSVVLTLLLTTFMLALTLLLLYLLWKNQRQRREYEQEAREELEAKVEERTRELGHTQKELVQAAKMAALGQLSAGINHELNNPLTAIRAYADNAAQFLDIGKPDIARHNLTEIIGLTERMAAITRQLKTFSRKSAGQIETCDLHRALDSALSIMQPKLAQTHIVLEQQRAEGARFVQADQVWLEQILVNLLSNAAEAVQEQTDQRIWITLQQADGQTCVAVRDNGPGISRQAMPHVFEAFFTTKTIGKGLGLGLSISYRLARDMHGDLSVGNAPEGGAVFTLSLPSANGSPP
ncbi:ATP-binding protein [Candidatus Thiothrix sp. Deng01]|uniref:histidine kinase n=1 Tax=Candidatus Thiothrix phosphatis TaxID=3112415 RepID=A0ABU6CVW4_9GAMM|nr:ATP-binding protein [Candidatus Thiothrix sp. Deng01]MEB4590924.1 ATP-binding protein [Candidatus Thiothrix sp. Deng01]